MKCQIVGVQRKTGSFTPKDRNEKVDYDNIVMHCVHKDMHVAGDAVDASYSKDYRRLRYNKQLRADAGISR